MTEAAPPVLIGALKISDTAREAVAAGLGATDVACGFADVEVAIEMTVVGNGWTLLRPLVSRLVCIVWRTVSD